MEGTITTFNVWAELKIKIHFSTNNFYPRERQIWWVSLGQNIGVEINGKNENFERPVLVLRRFSDRACLVVPISTKIKFGYYNLQFKNKQGILNTANFSQIRTISTKRFIRKIGKVSPHDFFRFKSLLKSL